jgi:site-specific DNA recombinase
MTQAAQGPVVPGGAPAHYQPRTVGQRPRDPGDEWPRNCRRGTPRTKKKNGRRYRYYVPQRDAKEHAGASGLPRLPAAELESAVLDQLRAILRAPNLLGDMLPQAIKLDPTLDEAKITVAMTRLDAIWDQLFPAEQTRIVKLLVEKVIVSPNDLEVRLRANGIERLVLELRPEPVEQQAEALA